MIFIRAGDYFLESKCRRYTVSKVSVEEGWVYVAWYGKECLNVGELEAMKLLCESHEKRLMLIARTKDSLKAYHDAQ